MLCAGLGLVTLLWPALGHGMASTQCERSVQSLAARPKGACRDPAMLRPLPAPYYLSYRAILETARPAVTFLLLPCTGKLAPR